MKVHQMGLEFIFDLHPDVPVSVESVIRFGFAKCS